MGNQQDDTNPELDLIRTSIPDGKPDWTENIAWDLHDPVAGISLYGHLGRLQPDRTIWEGLSLIYLPDGDMLLNRSLGASLAEARNGEYHYRPVVPGKLWQFTFDGVAQRVKPNDLRTRALGDDPFERVSYNLIFEGIQPLFNMHGTTSVDQHMHLEQGGRLTGAFCIQGQRIEVNCTAYRDHSVSERTFTTLDTETWAHCAFPSGKVFSMLEVRRGERQIAKGQVYRNGNLQGIEPSNFPVLETTEGSPHQGEIHFNLPSGGAEKLQWKTTGQFIPFNLLRPVGMRPGVDPLMKDGMVAVQCPAVFEWEGERGYGWMERTRPLAQLDKT
jgi:hypothetical protein